ncbi:DUF2971 domain-containing protein [Delftia acidovorans]|uniref:DUF2971 domain-containing protein n=1 Tax=Delftia acidovorans TaxID=80866 RepID=A0AAJ2R059_DELAC|nr:DUF2971 domain-containing protein [Delftia acidovorans]MDX4953503.1 DUF2971 domain-containing protein [Delftia acidovorans]
MILYKYYTPAIGAIAVKDKTVAFTRPALFNDPFELTNMLDSGDDEESFIHEWRHQTIRNSVGILCLTRSPMNPLMWAHYGLNHTGVVVGYEITPDDEFFNSSERSIITAEEGAVIYSQTKPSFELNERTRQLLKKIKERTFIRSQDVPKDVHNALRNFFLYKHSVWSYEEEVRIVKIFEHQYRSKSLLDYAQNALDKPRQIIGAGTSDMPEGSHCIFNKEVDIREIYFGVRCQKSTSLSIINDMEHSKCRAYQLSIEKNSWSLKANLIKP